MAFIPNTAPVNGPIAPIDSEDTYPTHFANYGKGGFYTVSTIAERNAIPADRRTIGMTVVVSSGNVLESSIYTLDAGLSNNDWKETFATNATVSVLASAAPGGFKNKIIGGDFLTNPWQRGVLFTPKNGNLAYGYRSNYPIYTADCFFVQNSESSSDANKKTLRTSKEILSDGSACLKVECTSSLALDSYSFAAVGTVIEGYNYAALYKSPMTLSFWVYSSIAGKYSVCFRNYRNESSDASWVANYTVSQANTWEKKVIVVDVPAADSGGSNWNFDNKAGLVVNWWLYAAPTYTTNLTNQWLNTSPSTLDGKSTGYVSTPGCVNAAVSGSTFKLRDIQLEAGIVASVFERLDVGTVLRQCQRYYQKSWRLGVAPLNSDQTALSSEAILFQNAFPGSDYLDNYDAGGPLYSSSVRFQTTMRATPTIFALAAQAVEDNGLDNGWSATYIRPADNGFTWTHSFTTIPKAYLAWFAESNIPF